MTRSRARARIAILGLAVVAALILVAPAARADTDSATHYHLSLGDSLATGTNAAGDGAAFTDLGYADQLHAALAADDPKLKLVKLGCPGESAARGRTVLGLSGTEFCRPQRGGRPHFHPSWVASQAAIVTVPNLDWSRGRSG